MASKRRRQDKAQSKHDVTPQKRTKLQVSMYPIRFAAFKQKQNSVLQIVSANTNQLPATPKQKHLHRGHLRARSDLPVARHTVQPVCRRTIVRHHRASGANPSLRRRHQISGDRAPRIPSIARHHRRHLFAEEKDVAHAAAARPRVVPPSRRNSPTQEACHYGRSSSSSRLRRHHLQVRNSQPALTAHQVEGN
jgi:hypothetical protein